MRCALWISVLGLLLAAEVPNSCQDRVGLEVAVDRHQCHGGTHGC